MHLYSFLGEILINFSFPFQNQMVQGVACLAANDGDIHIPGGGPSLIYVHISLGKIDLLSHITLSLHFDTRVSLYTYHFKKVNLLLNSTQVALRIFALRVFLVECFSLDCIIIMIPCLSGWWIMRTINLRMEP